jgi:NADH dehydrogenase (ubiquinone) 1 alpha subcomplex subunit 9
LKDKKSIERVVENSDVVINLIGQPRKTLNFTVEEANALGAQRIAQVCRESANKPTLIHVSHMSATPDSKSAYMRSKALGERLVREALPSAIIVRPSILFGQEDYFINAIGKS